MRLIHVNDYSITEFIGQGIPPYVILSHTWGASEVSLQDMQNLSAAKQKDGFKKIDYCCKQAEKNGLKWFWIDTCCIDKTSSAELSEAINSMFKWYSRSRICYAYLSDVSLSYDHGHVLDKSNMNAIRGSRWFTRGWTLQELLAPSTVWFFSSDWTYVGSKNRLATLLNEITCIPVNVLTYSKNFLEETVYERMYWASRRETTREEDMAYCLLGLFDINLPLLYGEGNKAFDRLQEEIIKQFDDHSIFLWDVEPIKGDVIKANLTFHLGRSYGHLLAVSPRQFRNRCNIEMTDIPVFKEPIHISRKGLRIQLYLTNITPEFVSSWTLKTSKTHANRYYLAALDCVIKDAEYVAKSTVCSVAGRREQHTAMLLFQHPDGSYERVPSYYETTSQEISKWTLTRCYIKRPVMSLQYFLSPYP
jgi:hypothetical protein